MNDTQPSAPSYEALAQDDLIREWNALLHTILKMGVSYEIYAALEKKSCAFQPGYVKK